MTTEYVPFLLVTANVGSVFEDPSRLLKLWINEFLGKISELKPQFVALHLQEVGGKTYEKSMEYVQEFIQILCESNELKDFNRIRVYLDEDYTSAEHFTALGNLYFVDKSIECVSIWNFLTHNWETIDGKSIHTGNIEAVATKEKAKFPQHFFPECKWSRKGFLRTRWNVSGSVIDMVNIHLFHDASNLAASEEYPSMYCKSRRRALVHTLERFHQDTKNDLAPYFVFGDFNFRCDTEGVVRKLTEDLSIHRILNLKNDNYKVQYRNPEGCNVLTVGKKEFFHTDHQRTFKDVWLQQFDCELDPLKDVLIEYPITFPPSYPYEEEPTLPKDYMLTRCPAWCDRILMSPTAKTLILDPNNITSSAYNTIGGNICMGDHKPVYLSIKIKVQQGTIRCCCEHANNITNAHGQQLLLLSKKKSALANTTNNTTITANTHTNIICLYSSKEFCDILLECRKLDSVNVSLPNVVIPSPKNNNQNPAQSPLLLLPASASSSLQSSFAPSQSFVPSEQLRNDVATGAVTATTISSSSTSATATASIAAMTTATTPNEPAKMRVTPTVSINVTDTENLSICMCSMYASSDTILIEHEQESMGIGSICPRCQNIIKQQPMEHRKTLISKRLTLANDIIVNRVDTHYLNLKSYQFGPHNEPYTPESVESHSPVAEAEDTDDLECKGGDEDIQFNGIKIINNQFNNDIEASGKYLNLTAVTVVPMTVNSVGVSPGQLKARLEKLRQNNSPNVEQQPQSTVALGVGDIALNSKSSNRQIKAKNRSKNNNCCVTRHCVIL